LKCPHLSLLKEKVPSRNVIAGVYPFDVIRHGTKEEVVDEAKRIIDILGPEGNLILNPNKRFIRRERLKLGKSKVIYRNRTRVWEVTNQRRYQYEEKNRFATREELIEGVRSQRR